ncbi:MAG TPA: hypothetical protein DEV97_07720 [Lachnospiraceae bacterium]|nr:hypothetical protein [Lachnospiraceae bacterium]
MAKYDLRYIQCARYVNTDGDISFTDKQKVGDAMTANIELRFAEGRLYAESTLAEYIRKCTGGTISLGVKYIKEAAQKLMFGLTEKTRSITPQGGTATSVKSLVTKRSTVGAYVGVSFYTPALYEGVEKYDCIFVGKCMFGEPSETNQTAGENIQFQTPVTNGEFLADDSEDGQIKEVCTVDSEALARAWCDAVLSAT